MHTKGHPRNSLFGMSWNPANVTLVIMLTLLFLIFLFLFLTLTAQPAMGQTYNVIYNIGTLGGSGLFPFAGVTIDRAGNLYVTTKENTGRPDTGTVFMLSHGGSGWMYSPIYEFRGGDDGSNPYDRVVFGPDGNLYGATASGGNGTAYCNGLGGCGTVFRLTKQGDSWQETVLYAFQGGSDGMWPYSGDLLFDRAGNIYGTTEQGGYTGGNCAARDGCGLVYKLTPSGGGYAESILYRFTDGADGGFPNAGVISDQAGNLYGATGGNTAYELMPSGRGWTENTFFTFQGQSEGSWPFGGLIFDQQGNLYGTTVWGGMGNAGTVFELTSANGNWTYNLLHTFVTPTYAGGNGPFSSLTMDAAGNFYGTAGGGGLYGWGAVFKLTRSGSSWTYTSLHDFCRGGYPCNDGASPTGGVTFDANGNLYGTTYYGGTTWGGVVWEITP
jgi:uncharacterized repeat protein (TIGR03803 family)